MTGEGSAEGIRKMFDWVAFRYDLFNRMATFGLDGSWRRHAAGLVPARGGMRVVDVCAGTGDMALELLRRLGGGSLVLGLDFSSHMLALCRGKLPEGANNVALAMGRSETMPLRSGSVDAACCSFALRNLEPVMDRFLEELFRILKPGGKAVLLETGYPTAPVLRQAHDLYLRRVLPLEGRLLTGKSPPFRYLAESVVRFSKPDEFCRRVEAAGFHNALFHRLSWGIATAYAADKPGG